MKKWLVIFVSLVIVLIVAAIVALYAFPGKVYSTIQSATASSAGLEKKSVEVNGYTVNYYEGGTGDSIVLLHGMADEKNSFAAAAGELTEQYHVILPDLQGHGENARDTGRDYSIRGHVEFIDKFLNQLSVNKFALGGNSMGGHVSLAYTLAYPEKVSSLVLVNAPGLKLDSHVVYGGFGEKMESREDFFAVMDRVVATRAYVPGPIVDFMIEQTNSQFDFINGLAGAVKTGQDFDLKEQIHSIEQPTLIIWGEADVVVKFNVAEAQNELIANSELIVIPNAGHSPQLEKAAEIGQLIEKFLSKQ